MALCLFVARNELVTPVAGLLQTTEVIAKRRKDRRAVGALYVAEESVRTDETVAWILWNRADDPTKHTVVKRTRTKLDKTFCYEIIDLRWARQNRRAVEVTTVSRCDWIEFFVPLVRESFRCVDNPDGEPHAERIV